MARDPNGQDIHWNSIQCNGDLTRTPVPQEDEVAKLPTDFQISVSNHTFLRLIASTPDAFSASESCSSAEISDSHILSNPPTLRESIYTHAHRSIRPSTLPNPGGICDWIAELGEEETTYGPSDRAYTQSRKRLRNLFSRTLKALTTGH